MENVIDAETNSIRAAIEMSNTKNENQESSLSNMTPNKTEPGAKFDSDEKELCEAALKIQGAFRGHLSRRALSREQSIELDIEKITKKVAEELQINPDDPELHKAATKIQASFRGHKSRKDTSAGTTE